ncbi:MAG: hypothetical protein KDC02_21085, partial [Flavobacteriales bacterium]|nr:hypothetical protein [Flavobacteriales bacterium]
LIANGHSVLVIEHDMDVIKCADHLIDLGPEGGDAGGEVLYAGAPEGLLDLKVGHTVAALKTKLAQVHRAPSAS